MIHRFVYAIIFYMMEYMQNFGRISTIYSSFLFWISYINIKLFDYTLLTFMYTCNICKGFASFFVFGMKRDTTHKVHIFKALLMMSRTFEYVHSLDFLAVVFKTMLLLQKIRYDIVCHVSVWISTKYGALCAIQIFFLQSHCNIVNYYLFLEALNHVWIEYKCVFVQTFFMTFIPETPY